MPIVVFGRRQSRARLTTPGTASTHKRLWRDVHVGRHLNDTGPLPAQAAGQVTICPGFFGGVEDAAGLRGRAAVRSPSSICAPTAARPGTSRSARASDPLDGHWRVRRHRRRERQDSLEADAPESRLRVRDRRERRRVHVDLRRRAVRARRAGGTGKTGFWQARAPTGIHEAALWRYQSGDKLLASCRRPAATSKDAASRLSRFLVAYAPGGKAPLYSFAKTNAARSSICRVLSRFPNDGITPEPHRIRCRMRNSPGRDTSRFGPAVPVAPAACSVWQPEHRRSRRCTFHGHPEVTAVDEE